MRFLITEVDLKVLRQKTIATVVFPFTLEGCRILRIVSPCGCSQPYVDNAANEVRVAYHPQDVPMQVKGNSYNTSKTLEVFYEDTQGLEQKTEITFKAIVTR